VLKPEDNERLARICPGTPAGALLRRYWQPAALSGELPEADGAPVRVRLLGEDLIAFRDSAGAVGLVDAFCPHRRAPMFFGRNEACGLRCVYHGWKFDRTGACVDMPSEPAGTPLQAKVKIKAYPTHEAGGVVWAYMGPKELRPEPPDYEWMRVPPTHRHVSKTFEHCNYLQGLEGGLDTAHSSFLHNNDMRNRSHTRTRDTSPTLDVETTDYGYRYISTRNVGEDARYVRVYHYVMPAQQMRGAVSALDGKKRDIPELDGHIWVPIDDEHTFVYNIAYTYDQSYPFDPEHAEAREAYAGRGREHLVPGTFELKANLSNDFFIDRQMQKTRTFTGIPGVNTQDFALQEGMGPICDRSKEFLGASDKAIVAMRRLMLDAVREIERGGAPRGADPRTHRTLRAHDDILRGGADWREAFAADLVAKW
jgi:phenylpropionate dioxygenase-like ring-hydroxylating dioxygenase large terminal subunit